MPYDYDKDKVLAHFRENPIEYVNNSYIRCKKYETRVQPVYSNIGLLEYQKEMLKLILNNRVSVINSGRYLGITSVSFGAIMFLTSLFDNSKVLILDTDTTESISALFRYNAIYSYTPEHFKRDIKYVDKVYLELDNGSTVEVYNPSLKRQKESKYDLILIDNASFVNDLKTVIDNCYSKLKEDGRLVIQSNLFKDSYFRELCAMAELEITDYRDYRYMRFNHLQSKIVPSDSVIRGLEKNGPEYAAFHDPTKFIDKDGNLQDLITPDNYNLKYEGPKNIYYGRW